MSLASVWKFVKEWAKTIAAFVAGVVANMIVNLVQGGTVWPQTKAEWIQYVLTSFGTAIAVSLTHNKITDKQIDKDPTVVRVDEQGQPAPAAPPAGGYRNPWRPTP